MDGTTELSKEEVNKSEPVKEYTPEKDNYIFMGWYATPTLSHKYDFSTPVTADTKVFAGFLEEKEDTRSFSIVGSGKSPILVTSNWGTVIDDSHKLTKEANGNAYSINIDLYEGDEFQLAMNTSWHNQRGAGYLTTTSLDGTEYFAGAGSNYQANEAQRANIKTLKSGNYTLKLTTYPGADVYDTENENYTEETRESFNSNPYDTIEWVYNGEPKDAIADVETSYYLKSSITTNWNDVYEDQYRFKEIDGLPTLTIELVEKEEFLFTSTVKTGDKESVGNEYVKFSNIKDTNSLEFVEGSASDNIIAKAAGEYTFIYNPGTKELTVTFK
ncbi:Listeria-Bacteroides repeat domain [compost metagenome]